MDDFIEHYQAVVSDGSDLIPSWVMSILDGMFMMAVGIFVMPLYVLGLIVRLYDYNGDDHER